MKIPKRHLKQVTFHSLQSHVAYQHSKLLVSKRHLFCESLLKMQQFRNKWLLIIGMGNSLKTTGIPINGLYTFCQYNIVFFNKIAAISLKNENKLELHVL